MKLADRLRADFKQFSFVKDNISRWSPVENTIFYNNNDTKLLHELGHAVCRHTNFTQDIELLHLERDAWEKAREIGIKYDIKISNKSIENAMDEYREWLYQRSLCPGCNQTGLQNQSDGRYECLNCNNIWIANDARNCSLKRRKITKNTL